MRAYLTMEVTVMVEMLVVVVVTVMAWVPACRVARVLAPVLT